MGRASKWLQTSGVSIPHLLSSFFASKGVRRRAWSWEKLGTRSTVWLGGQRSGRETAGAGGREEEGAREKGGSDLFRSQRVKRSQDDL